MRIVDWLMACCGKTRAVNHAVHQHYISLSHLSDARERAEKARHEIDRLAEDAINKLRRSGTHGN